MLRHWYLCSPAIAVSHCIMFLETVGGYRSQKGDEQYTKEFAIDIVDPCSEAKQDIYCQNVTICRPSVSRGYKTAVKRKSEESKLCSLSLNSFFAADLFLLGSLCLQRVTFWFVLFTSEWISKLGQSHRPSKWPPSPQHLHWRAWIYRGWSSMKRKLYQTTKQQPATKSQKKNVCAHLEESFTIPR